MASGRRDGDGGGRGLGLAQRFRAALEARADAGRRAAEAERRRKERAEQARRALLADLAAFGRALGHGEVTATERRVVIGLDGRHLRFELAEDGESVAVSGDGLRRGWRLEFNHELQRWGLFPPHGAVRPFFDKGLEELLVRVFELRPAAVEDGAGVSEGEDSSSVTGTRGGRDR